MSGTLDLTANESELQRYLDEVDENGYCIVEGAIEPELVAEIRETVARITAIDEGEEIGGIGTAEPQVGASDAAETA